MERRGPDAEGEWSDREMGVCIGHRRLSIIDLDVRANQPMRSADGRYVIVFNGEIYNYRQLRAELEAKGTRFRTTGDTEVILELYRTFGEGALPQLRGMFAIAIWDTANRSFFLARDPYGIKPLYLAQSPAGSLFASQVKALIATGLVSRQLDPAGIAGFHIWGSVPEPFTMYRDVKPVPAGCYVAVNEHGISAPVRYSKIESAWMQRESLCNLRDHVRHSVMESVRAHLVADVPIAVLLSGGVDSGVLAGCAAEVGQAVEGVTIGFDEFSGRPEDEVPRAQLVAKHYGIDHTIRRIDKAEFIGDIPGILEAMDQPSIDGVNTWFAAKAVAERGYKVVLSGVGGDELFCGYGTFRTVPRLLRLGGMLPDYDLLRQAVQFPISLVGSILGKPKLQKVTQYTRTLGDAYLLCRALMMPGEIRTVMNPEMADEGLRALAAGPEQGTDDASTGALEPVERVAVLESTRYLRNQLLRDADWASMAHSLELRTPLVDWLLLRQLAPHLMRFVAGNGKDLLSSVPVRSLPNEILSHRKTGFGMPFGGWLDNIEQRARALPASMRSPWARRWACVVGEAFALNS